MLELFRYMDERKKSGHSLVSDEHVTIEEAVAEAARKGPGRYMIATRGGDLLMCFRVKADACLYLAKPKLRIAC